MSALSKPTAAAAAIGVCTETLRRWAESGQLPARSVVSTPGGHRRYRVDVLMQWMQERSKATAAGGEVSGA
ncbi:MAG TPA: helix-turn-helix domain-containing protein [Thermoleophilia bacterium]|nr:helix-turn-helix domain-containing protein [Thermoleophilia bacterium]